MDRDVIDKRAIEKNLAAIAQARNMLFATFNHHIPRSASLIDESSVVHRKTKLFQSQNNPARELALMNAGGLLPALTGSRVKADLNWHDRCWTRQRRMGSQRWDARTGLPPIGARIVKEAGANE